MYNNEVVEQHENGFNKAIRQVGFFAKDLDLDLFNPFKDVKDDVMLDEEDTAVKEEAGKEQNAKEQGDDVNVQDAFSLFFFIVGFLPHRLCNYDNFSSNAFAFLC